MIMTQTLEEAAREAIQKHYNCNGEYPCGERNYCMYFKGSNLAYDCAECGADEFNEGFIAGAEWQKKQIKSDIIRVGDLVETCALIPGLVVRIDSNNPNNIEVMHLNKIGVYVPGRGASHNVMNCGVRKISTERVMMLCALGEKRLKELYENENFNYCSDDTIREEFEKLNS